MNILSICFSYTPSNFDSGRKFLEKLTKNPIKTNLLKRSFTIFRFFGYNFLSFDKSDLYSLTEYSFTVWEVTLHTCERDVVNPTRYFSDFLTLPGQPRLKFDNKIK